MRVSLLARLGLVCLGCVLLAGCNDREQERYPAESYAPPRTVFQSPVAPESVAPPTTVVVNSPTRLTAPDIRVAILKDAPTLRLTAPAAGARIILAGSPWKQLPGGAVVNVSFEGTSLLLENTPVGVASAQFESFAPDAMLRLNDHDASSRVTVSHLPGHGGLLAVAQLSLEEYLAGVLAGEVPYDRWHAEALKAQAVVSRTFAYFEMRNRANDPYDVESTVMSQVFRGGYRAVPQLMAAVDGTRGQVLTSNGSVFPAYFHSTCGGHTEGAAGIFPEYSGVKPLCGVNCAYCSASPAFRWKLNLSKEQVATKLHVQKIESITFTDAHGLPLGANGEFRRVQNVAIKHSGGVLQLQGNAFRLQVGPKELKSLLIGQVSERGDTLEISGGGFGHGVGMCQYGSEGMAASGEAYMRILGLYYPGAALTRAY